MNWSGPRGMSWSVHNRRGQHTVIPVAVEGRDTILGHLGSETPVLETTSVTNTEALSQSAFAGLGLMIPALSKTRSTNNKPGSESSPSEALSPALHGLLSTMLRGRGPKTQSCLSVSDVPGGGQREKRDAVDAVSGTVDPNAYMKRAQTLIQVQKTEAAGKGEGVPVQATPVALDRGSITQRMAAVLASSQKNTEGPVSEVPGTPKPQAYTERAQMSIQMQKAQAAGKGVPVQAIPVASHQGTIVQRMTEVLTSKQTRSRATSAHPIRGDMTFKTSQSIPTGVSQPAVQRNTANAALTMNTPLTSSMPLMSPMGLNSLRSLFPSLALAPRLQVVNNGVATSGQGMDGESAFKVQVDAPHRVTFFSDRPGMPEVSSGAANAPSMPQLLAQMRGGIEVQLLTSLVDTLEGRVQKQMERLVEKKLEQLPPPVTKTRTKAPSVDVDTTALVSDEIVQTLMRKMRELDREARFRSGRLR